MSIKNQVIEIVQQVTNKQVISVSYKTKEDKGVLLFFNDAICVDKVAEIEKAVTPFFESIGIKSSMSGNPNTFDVSLQSTTDDDDGAYLTIFFDYTNHYIKNL